MYLEITLSGILLVAVYVFYKFYLSPKREIERYKAIFKNLGYRVYQMPFAFLGASAAVDWERGAALHNDAEYFQRTVLPHVDASIGNVLDKPLIYLVKPELMREFLSASNTYRYPKQQSLLEGIKLTTGEGLVFSEGEVWKKKRILMSKIFNFDLLKENIPKIIEICDKAMNFFDKNSQISQNTFKYDTVSLSSRMFNGVMMKCFFGSDQVEDEIDGKNFEEFLLEVATESSQVSIDILMMLFGKLAWELAPKANIRRVKEKSRLLKVKTTEILKKRMQEVLSSPKKEKYTDIIEALVHEKLANEESFLFSDDELIAQFRTFLIAGTDTTSRFFSMMLFYIGNNPTIEERLRKEVGEVIKSDKDINWQNLKKIKYIDWIQNETSRVYGPANGNFWRIATEDNYIADIPIKKNTLVSNQAKGNHYNPKYFKNPNEFRPERWESECDEIDSFAFVPFSAGPRACIGKQLAHLQSKIALIKLIQRYKKFEVPKEVKLIMGLLLEAEKFDITFTK